MIINLIKFFYVNLIKIIATLPVSNSIKEDWGVLLLQSGQLMYLRSYKNPTENLMNHQNILSNELCFRKGKGKPLIEMFLKEGWEGI